MKEVLQSALVALSQGEQVTLVSVVEAHGSTPRGVGAVMAVGASGLLAGTVGGGAIEHRAMALAQEKLGAIQGWTETFRLTNEEAGGLGMVCGGNTTLLFTPLENAASLEQMLSSHAASPALHLPLDGGAPVVGEGDKARVIAQGGAPHLVLPLCHGGRIFLIGGGHVAVETAHLLGRLEMRHFVVDDRAEFATQARFPDAVRVVVAPLDQLHTVFTGADAPQTGDCFCIMTRGHQGDTQALRFALSTPAGYIGVMGSRKKRETVFAKLEAEGFSDVRHRVTTPIGLPIGGQTPAELAVSVAAQLIQWRASKQEAMS